MLKFKTYFQNKYIFVILKISIYWLFKIKVYNDYLAIKRIPWYNLALY